LVKSRRKLRPEDLLGFGVVATLVAAVVWVWTSAMLSLLKLV